MNKNDKNRRLTTSLFVVLLLMVCATTSVKAQGDNAPGPFVISGSWQFNSNFNNHTANEFSGWGAQIEMGYHVSKRIDLGSFVSWHTNRKYFARETQHYPDYTVNTDRLYSMFQVPFGFFTNVNFLPDRIIEPYIGLKVGCSYIEETTYHNVFKFNTSSWAFYTSPEAGFVTYPFRMGRICGFKAAIYYTFSNNKVESCTEHVRNWGFRLGIFARI